VATTIWELEEEEINIILIIILKKKINNNTHNFGVTKFIMEFAKYLFL
jgi:hypothetical protein